MLEDGYMNWQAGDTAIVGVRGGTWVGHNHDGETCQLMRFDGLKSFEDGREVPNAWYVNGKNNDFWVDENYLRKPYDGNEKTEWKTCVFQPKELVVTKALAITTWAF